MKIYRRKHRLNPFGAFTLLEVTIAVVIFAVTLAALMTTLKTGLHAWQTGHGLSDVFQTARITQDVIVRDLNNMQYQTKQNYNKTFYQQAHSLARAAAANGDEGGDAMQFSDESPGNDEIGRRQGNEMDQWGGLTPGNITPPVDLSFSGADSGKTDRLNFARSYKPREEGEANTWGLRRVSYYVKEGVLYREETDPYGIPSGAIPPPENSNMGLPAMNVEPNQESRPDLGNETDYNNGGNKYRHNYRPERTERRTQRRPDEDNDGIFDMQLPDEINVAEPLCEGVEVFDITYGYFKDGRWQEVTEWDSGASNYRNQEKERNDDFSNFEQDENRQLTMPDDLPGYMAVQVGVRPVFEDKPKKNKKKGKLYSFTFVYAMPMAQETDLLMQEEGGNPIPPNFQANLKR